MGRPAKQMGKISCPFHFVEGMWIFGEWWVVIASMWHPNSSPTAVSLLLPHLNDEWMESCAKC